MKYLLIWIIGFIAGGFSFWLAPENQVVEAKGYTPVPSVVNECDEWHVVEDGPDYYWDGAGTETQSSTADYWTIEMGLDGAEFKSEPAGQGEDISVPASDNGTLELIWWDSDRPGEPEELSRVRVGVGDC